MRHQRKGMHALWRASPFSGRFVWSDLADSKKPHCGRWRGHPLFRRGSRCARAFEQGRIPMLTRESKQEPSAREVEKRLGDKIYGGSFAGFSPSADVEGSQRTGKCMYIKARRNQGLRMRCSEQFHWQLKIVLWPREERPLFRRVSRCVRSCWRRRVCTRFHPRKQTWAICARS